MYSLLIFTLVMCFSTLNCKIIDNYESYCLDAKHHKEKPAPEDSLHGECSPWKNKSCCSMNTTLTLHSLNLYNNFNFEHCGSLSDSCKKHFIRDSCFYECSPNIGPWVINLTQSSESRKQRFHQVPLCQSVCNEWFDDCKQDKTCFMNWAVELKGEKNCSKDCVTFENMYKDAKTFCEKVWDDSWLVTPDDKPCMKLWFNVTEGNPNEEVAAKRVQEMRNGADTYMPFIPMIYFVVGVLMIIY